MKNIIVTFFMLNCLFAFSQHHKYSYDASGNRIKREYELIQNPGGSIGEELNEDVTPPDSSNFKLVAYPNPIEDVVTIEIITNEPTLDIQRIQLFTETGQFLSYLISNDYIADKILLLGIF